MAKRKPDGVAAAEPMAKRRTTHNRKELDLSETQLVVNALMRKPDQQRMSLPCTIHDGGCSCRKKSLRINMYKSKPGVFFELSNKHTGLPFMPTGPEGDDVLLKATAELFAENPSLPEQNRNKLVNAVATMLLDKFDLLNPVARILRILDDALELAREQKDTKPAAVSQDQHDALKDSIVAGFATAASAHQGLTGIVTDVAHQLKTISGHVERHGQRLHHHSEQLELHDSRLKQHDGQLEEHGSHLKQLERNHRESASKFDTIEKRLAAVEGRETPAPRKLDP